MLLLSKLVIKTHKQGISFLYFFWVLNESENLLLEAVTFQPVILSVDTTYDSLGTIFNACPKSVGQTEL